MAVVTTVVVMLLHYVAFKKLHLSVRGQNIYITIQDDLFQYNLYYIHFSVRCNLPVCSI